MVVGVLLAHLLQVRCSAASTPRSALLELRTRRWTLPCWRCETASHTVNKYMRKIELIGLDRLELLVNKYSLTVHNPNLKELMISDVSESIEIIAFNALLYDVVYV